MKGSEVGTIIWFPCEVRGGPFQNERRVYVKTTKSEWFGFVDVSDLKEAVDGTYRVRAVVLAVGPREVVLGIRGQSPAGDPIQAERSVIAQYGALPT